MSSRASRNPALHLMALLGITCLLVFLALTMGVGCTPSAVEAPPATKITDLPLAWDSKGSHTKAWTKHLIDELYARPALLAVDIKDAADYCPNYAKLTPDQRVAFYATMTAEATRWESSFNPESSTRECRKKTSAGAACSTAATCHNAYGSNGRWDGTYGWCMKGGHALDNYYVISRGPIQMSLQSSQHYGCKVSVPRDLNDPLKNFSCFVQVAERFITADGRVGSPTTKSPWYGLTKYWAVWRGSDTYTLKARTAIRAATKALPFCKL